MKVVHCKREPFDVLIDRRTKWGNPFVIGKDGTREEVIAKYAAWVPTQQHLMDSLHELKDKTLGCWCAPQACHGDVLIRLVEDWPAENYTRSDRPSIEAMEAFEEQVSRLGTVMTLIEEVKKWLDDRRYYSGGPGAEAELRTAVKFLERVVDERPAIIQRPTDITDYGA